MARNKAYAVFRGRAPGVYLSWEDCEVQVIGFPRALYRGFKTHFKAEKSYRFRPNGFTTIKSLRLSKLAGLFEYLRRSLVLSVRNNRCETINNIVSDITYIYIAKTMLRILPNALSKFGMLISVRKYHTKGYGEGDSNMNVKKAARKAKKGFVVTISDNSEK
ncbi:unnamed protein product [Dovyalis caffra]|uniref:Ribonuclease H1 N-terminal domain-containing protein n=1 Tax=Dovyalis caffra TaxID=77055 RepID=A0AAV1RG65_9ROSI|nr:unnamed protein product [Dovyalis caffra]